MILADLTKEAGFPDGVLNIVHGSNVSSPFSSWNSYFLDDITCKPCEEKVFYIKYNYLLLILPRKKILNRIYTSFIGFQLLYLSTCALIYTTRTCMLTFRGSMI